jgi:hypothetical protein
VKGKALKDVIFNQCLRSSDITGAGVRVVNRAHPPSAYVPRLFKIDVFQTSVVGVRVVNRAHPPSAYVLRLFKIDVFQTSGVTLFQLFCRTHNYRHSML